MTPDDLRGGRTCAAKNWAGCTFFFGLDFYYDFATVDCKHALAWLRRESPLSPDAQRGCSVEQQTKPVHYLHLGAVVIQKLRE